MVKRRGRGEGGVYQRHDHPSCPPADNDGGRPKHTCRGRWVGTFDITQAGGGRRRKTVYGRTRKEAGDKLIHLQREYLAGNVVTGAPSVERWMRYWLEHVAPEDAGGRARPKTIEGYRWAVDVWIIPQLGRHRLDKLEPAHIRAMYKRMRQECPDPKPRCRCRPRHRRVGEGEGECHEPVEVCTHKPGHDLSLDAVHRVRAVLHRALRIAIREGKLTRNVASSDFMDPPPQPKKHRKPLSLEHVKQVLKTAKGDRLESRYYAALYLGLRQGEVLGLRIGNVNLDEPALYVVESDGALQRQKGRGLVFVDPKSAKSVRRVPLPTMVASRLAVTIATRIAEGAQPSDLVWVRDGKPIDPRWDWGAWTDLLARAGVPHAPLHAARSTTATLLRDAGVDQTITKQIMGHSTVVLTKDVYQDAVDPVQSAKAMKALERHVSEGETTPE